MKLLQARLGCWAMAAACMPAALLVDASAMGAEGLPNPFYAMDTCTKRPYPRNDIPPAEQLQMLKELGYAGIAWTDEPADQVAAALKAAEARGLRMYAIYFAATVTPEGGLSYSERLKPAMEVLKGHDTLIWLHIGGRGPAFDALKGDEPAVQTLRELADDAAQAGLRVAIYPHVGEWTARVADAIALARLVDRPNLGVTFNLCHALAMGDEERVAQLIRAAGKLLFAVTINGADAGVAKPDWKRLIQTLDGGTYDTGIVLRALREIGYTGPVGLQGYGLGGDRRENLERSMAAWQKLSAAAP